ncbi:phosphatase PAP2 family protein [Mesorhizobium sp. J428]|uniref:phosphatase PAP2 family protein n=1 Tax=Mesorhizobium sp. J428 TaxID=2898440 RepID=UPI002150D057|nr:phosphatase PAP2 family protein [Mesorhizobium sp. J428]MCR5859124.1 phosphatase PAP2 family protein [Mesorhizobium sp. J428]
MTPFLEDDYLWPCAGRRPAIVLIALIAGTLLFFNVFPWIDIAVSELFFKERVCVATGKICGTFPLSSSPVFGPIRQLLQVTPVTLAVLLLLAITWRVVARRSLAHPFDRAGLAAVASMVIGAGLLVNLVLKEHWGRPRPYMTDLFGGPYPFVPAGHITDYCATNCSFVSGEAASSFWLVALATLTPRAYRNWALAAAFTVATGTSLLRVAFGGHYLSDVILGALLSLLIFTLLATGIRMLAQQKAHRSAGQIGS